MPAVHGRKFCSIPRQRDCNLYFVTIFGILSPNVSAYGDAFEASGGGLSRNFKGFCHRPAP